MKSNASSKFVVDLFGMNLSSYVGLRPEGDLDGEAKGDPNRPCEIAAFFEFGVAGEEFIIKYFLYYFLSN